MIWRHPGYGSRAEAGLQIVQDARSGLLGRLTPAMALEVILGRQKSWCVGGTGWTWLTVQVVDDTNDEGEAYQYLDFAGDTGPWHVSGYNDKVYTAKMEERRKKGGGWRDVRSNLAAHEYDAMGWSSFVSALDDQSEKYLPDACDTLARTGMIPGQQALIRGTAWAHYDAYSGEHDGGYECELIYAPPAEADHEALIAAFETVYDVPILGRADGQA